MWILLLRCVQSFQSCPMAFLLWSCDDSCMLSHASEVFGLGLIVTPEQVPFAEEGN